MICQKIDIVYIYICIYNYIHNYIYTYTNTITYIHTDPASGLKANETAKTSAPAKSAAERM